MSSLLKTNLNFLSFDCVYLYILLTCRYVKKDAEQNPLEPNSPEIFHLPST